MSNNCRLLDTAASAYNLNTILFKGKGETREINTEKAVLTPGGKKMMFWGWAGQRQSQIWDHDFFDWGGGILSWKKLPHKSLLSSLSGFNKFVSFMDCHF